MAKHFIINHGEGPSNNESLSKEGLLQVIDLAKKLRKELSLENMVFIHYSPDGRAKETARHLRAYLLLEGYVVSFGSIDELSIDEEGDMYNQFWLAKQIDESHKFPNRQVVYVTHSRLTSYIGMLKIEPIFETLTGPGEGVSYHDLNEPEEKQGWKPF